MRFSYDGMNVSTKCEYVAKVENFQVSSAIVDLVARLRFQLTEDLHADERRTRVESMTKAFNHSSPHCCTRSGGRRRGVLVDEDWTCRKADK